MNPRAVEAALAMSSEKVSMSLKPKDLKGIQPGDIILTSSKGESSRKRKQDSRMVRTFGSLSRVAQGGYTHSVIYDGGGNIVESEAHGIDAVVRRPLKDVLKNRDGAVVVRVKAPKKVRMGALRYAKNQLGAEYGDKSTLTRQGLALVGPRAATKFLDSSDTPAQRKKFTCGNLLTAAFESQGHKINDDERSWFLGVPADFLNKRKSKLVKVIGPPDRQAPLTGRIKDMARVTAKLAEDINSRRRLNVGNTLATAGALGGAAWGLSRRGRFNASWMNPAWKGQFGMKQRLAQGLMGAGTGAAIALPAHLVSTPLVNRVQPAYDKSKAMVQNRALPGWGK